MSALLLDEALAFDPPVGGDAALREPPPAARWDVLDQLESEAIHILREAAALFERRALLFSGGKDSAVLWHLARKAFAPAPAPFPLLHIDTGHNFPEVLAFRDQVAAASGTRLIVWSLEAMIAKGALPATAPGAGRNAQQGPALLDAIAELGLDACIGGARRDEERARAKERVFSHRDAFGQWDPRRQRPELWSLYNPRLLPGEHMRVFPLSNWAELDVWRYLGREAIALPSIYFAHRRKVVRREPGWLPLSPLVAPRRGELAVERSVRFRTVGDMTCTLAVESDAATIAAVIAETAAARLSERGATRLDDRAGKGAMERRKREGYF